MPTFTVDPTAIETATTFNTIQAAINAASAGDIVTVSAGTYTEDLTVSAGITLQSDGGVVKTGSILINELPDGATMTIDGIDFDKAESTGRPHGIRYDGDYADTQTVVLNIQNVEAEGFGSAGISVNGGGAFLSVNFDGVDTTGNGTTGGGGSGEISLFQFNGNVDFKDVTVVGTGTVADHAIQIAGYEDIDSGSGDVVENASGSITFESTSVTGTFDSTFVFIQGYNDLAGLDFDGLTVGDATSSNDTWPAVYVNPTAGAPNYTGPADGVTNLDMTGLVIGGGTYGGFGTGAATWINGTSNTDSYISGGLGTVFWGMSDGDTITLNQNLTAGDFTFTPAALPSTPATWSVDLGGGVSEIIGAPASGSINFVDAQGDTFALGATAASLDSTAPTVSSVSFSDAVITDADDENTVTLTVTFSEDMNQGEGLEPTVTLVSPAGTTLSELPESAGWATATTFTVQYTVDADSDAELDNIQVMVTGGQDAGGNALATVTVASTDDIDTTADLGGDLAVSFTGGNADLTYNENEDIVVSVVGLDDDATGTLTISSDDGSSVTLAASVTDNGNVTLSAAEKADLGDGALTASLAVTDTDGNTASATANSYALEVGKPTIDTLTITGEDGADDVISDADTSVVLAITFSELMDTTTPSAVTVALNTTDLTETTRAWSGNTLNVTYSVADNGNDLTDITATISGAKDVFGNTMDADNGRTTATSLDMLNPVNGTGAQTLAENPDGLPQTTLDDTTLATFDNTDGVVYTFASEGNPGGAFAINGNTLEIADAAYLDLEENGPAIAVNLIATDDAGNTTEFTYTVNLTDVNDAPVVDTDQLELAKTLEERADQPLDAAAENNPVGFGTTGTFDFTDDDATDTHTIGVLSTVKDGTGATLGDPLGFLTAGSSGPGEISWTFGGLNATDMAAVDALAVTESIVQVFTVTIDDGNTVTTQDITITIEGTNDAPEITGATSDTATEQAMGATTASGTITFTDVDLS
ncbi:VCBS domain-containing protein, partial [uncultured Sulfitobacter sp.]|uniref:beta strand repeat-containing protein n=1 Tax=uncultured Sulfitobacter sp. TaxID=191468 RepID=UPI0026327D6F